MNAKNNLDKTRGYQKIAAACQKIGVDFRNKIVLDIGSSTGGFSEYALSYGAQKVIAIEKGSHQMSAPLCLNPRVELHEKTDIFSVSSDLSRDTIESSKIIIAAPDLILADVSFISLTKILLYVKNYIAAPQTQFFAMAKPQFEASPDQLSQGIVKNSRIRRDILKHFELWLRSHGFIVLDKADNTLAGKHGNLERFYLLSIAKS